KLRIAVIGVGFWGKNHARVLSELPETELVAICDLDLERAQGIAEKYGVEAYKDSREMLHLCDIDAASVCTWTTTHAVEALRVLRADRHVLVEKPLASTITEAKKIVTYARAKKRHLMVGFIERFNPSVQNAKAVLKEGKIGELVSATAKRVSQWPERIGDVGVVKDYAIHDIDIMRRIFEEDPKTVYARVGNLKHKEYEDYAQIMLTFKGGRTAFMEANWLTPYKIRDLTLTGSDAILSLDYIKQEITVETSERTLKPRYEWKEPLKLELQHFAESILADRQPEVTGVDGLKALVIAEAAIKSSKQGRAIDLMLEKHN
ncbi:MAG: Gfo/Idh/MocA family oxidoreductase, partial [Candidatus Bathyarchaeota archaeon]|nr:Gfo/Idh/MocA family oxidoreductase [Candidatus Bathyarchaeota archaeon]